MLIKYFSTFCMNMFYSKNKKLNENIETSKLDLVGK